MFVKLRHQVRRSREERGFTMLLALYVLMITTLLLGAAYVAVLNDTGLSRNDLDQSRALAAAQAGIAQYSDDLNLNPNFWETCYATPSGSPVAVGSAASGSIETFVIAPLLASTAPSGTTSCATTTATVDMIEGATLTGGGTNPAAGTFRIESTGTSNNVSRTIVAQYRRASFLDFIYYTDYETFDPATEGYPTDCADHWPDRNADCGVPINFTPGDVINGPMHTEDTAAVCGDGTSSDGPVFGRAGGTDQIQVAALSAETNPPGGGVSGTHYNGSGCQDTYKIDGTLVTNAQSLTPPPSNAQLLNIAQSGGTVDTGTTTIVLNGTTMNVTNNTTGITTNNVPWPANGVLYVQSAATPPCGEAYTPFTADSLYPPSEAANITSCGNVFVSGNYSNSLTIASDSDVIIDGNLYPTGTPLMTPMATPSGQALLGLVPDKFVRVEHGVNSRPSPCSGATNTPGQFTTSPFIYAAILSVTDSFIVDNYDCGSALGTLHVYGTIAQLYRGPVGTSGSQPTGYLKDYNYDNRLQYAEPPYFLNPVSVAWKVQRQTECNGSGC